MEADIQTNQPPASSPLPNQELYEDGPAVPRPVVPPHKHIPCSPCRGAICLSANSCTLRSAAACRRARATRHVFHGGLFRTDQTQVVGEAVQLHCVPGGVGRALIDPASHGVAPGALESVMPAGAACLLSLEDKFLHQFFDGEPHGGLFLLGNGELRLHAHGGVVVVGIGA